LSINAQAPGGTFAVYTAELYDKTEDYADDVALIRDLLSNSGNLDILEPFCGSGRIMLPLLEDGHRVHGLDCDDAMIARTRVKLSDHGAHVAQRARITRMDAVDEDWPSGFDLVILGANCFYQLGSADEQEAMIRRAARSLRPGGRLYIENDNMEGPLDDSWCRLDDKPRPWKFPDGVCEDGTRVGSLIQVIHFDKPRRLWHARRRTLLERPDGTRQASDWYTVQTHPASAVDIQQWLGQYGFEILGRFRSTDRAIYRPGCARAIFWAQLFE
jgi:SAM-dependent methyltransferase